MEWTTVLNASLAAFGSIVAVKGYRLAARNSKRAWLRDRPRIAFKGRGRGGPAWTGGVPSETEWVMDVVLVNEGVLAGRVHGVRAAVGFIRPDERPCMQEAASIGIIDGSRMQGAGGQLEGEVSYVFSKALQSEAAHGARALVFWGELRCIDEVYHREEPIAFAQSFDFAWQKWIERPDLRPVG